MTNIKQQLTGKHQQAILNNTDISKPGFEQPYAASSCTNISIEFAVEVLEGLIDAPTWSNAANYDVVQNKITELKQSLTPTL